MKKMTILLTFALFLIPQIINAATYEVEVKATDPIERSLPTGMNITHDFTIENKGTKADSVLWLEDGKPMVFGSEKNKGIRLDGNKPIIVEIGDKWGLDDVLVHDESDYVIASLLSNLTYQSDFPDPIGVLYAIESVTYEDLMMAQINEAIKKSDKKSVQDILNSGDTWIVE